jgi:hypothetical protein
MRNIIALKNYLNILRIYLVLELLSLNRHIIFQSISRSYLWRRTAYSSKSLYLTNRPVLEENFLHIGIQELKDLSRF